MSVIPFLQRTDKRLVQILRMVALKLAVLLLFIVDVLVLLFHLLEYLRCIENFSWAVLRLQEILR